MIYETRKDRNAFICAEDESGKLIVNNLNRIPYIENSYTENWFQELIADNPYIIPTFDIDEKYSDMVCIGREVEVGSGDTLGFIDNLYVTKYGDIAVVETKLYRNQESRRTVVAQIIDYAKELQKWDAEKLDRICSEYTYKRFGQAFLIKDLLARHTDFDFKDESRLVDRLNRNLSSANFLLMIIGDGIRSNVEQIAEFINSHTSMSFHLALVALEIYKSNYGTVIIPNILLKTTVVERSFYNTDYFMKEETGKDKSKNYWPLLSQREYITEFANKAYIDRDILDNFILEISNNRNIGIKITPTQLRLILKIDGADILFIIFDIASNDAQMYMIPYDIKNALEEMGYSEAGNELLTSCRKFIDSRRSRSVPYDWSKRKLYFFDIELSLKNPLHFLSAIEKFNSYFVED